MGIIEKQATKGTLYSYLGAILGFVTVIGMSHSLSTDENGLLRVLVSISTLFAQFANLGFTTVTIRFFPYFRDKEKGHNGFLFYALIVPFVGFALCMVVFYLFKEDIAAKNIDKSRLLVDYLFYLMPLAFFTLFFIVLDTYLRANFSTIVGSFYKDVLQRILILVVLALYFFQLIAFPVFIFGYIVASCLPTLLLIYEIKKQNEWHTKRVKGFVTKELSSQMIKLAFFSILSAFSGAIIANIDIIMVNDKLGLSETGVYGIAFYFGSVMLIPSRSLYRIASSIVAEAFKRNDLAEILQLYRKSCNTQFTIALLFFIGICVIYTFLDFGHFC